MSTRLHPSWSRTLFKASYGSPGIAGAPISAASDRMS